MTPGDTITCEFAVENIGAAPATVTTLREISPFPGGTPANITCTAGGTTISVGSTLANDVPCTGEFEVTIPQDPTLCGTFVSDRVEIALRYTPVLVADAGATGITFIECPAEITITKEADALSKVGDSVTYTFEICNVGEGVVTRGTVTDTLLGDLTQFFPADLDPDECVEVVRMRTVVAGDPDPLANTVTATYSTGASSDTATASDSTNLFQPNVDVTKTCTPNPVIVGEVVTCTIVVTDTSSDDAPALVNGTIEDSLTGNLLAAGNTAVVSSNCTAALPDPAGAPQGTCTIVTRRTVMATDPDRLCNTVTVNYNPQGFPNNITDTATACVDVKRPVADIKITKTADALSKIGDPVDYTFRICNVGDITVTRGTVTDTLLGILTEFFPATLTPGQCETVVRTRTVVAGDADPLPNTVTATYTARSGTPFESSDTDTATASTNLFQPSVDVTKTCTPNPVVVGEAVTCTIVVTDTSSDDAPALVNGTIEDSLTGNLLAAGNTAVVSSNCTAALPDPAGAPQGTCTIVTRRTVMATDPDRLCNTVTVNYNPQGFPNNITDTATACVDVKRPGGEGCTPGYWKQDQHFDSWVGFAPDDSFEEVFGVDVTLRAGGQNTIDDPTLLDALNAGGGGVNALARHAVAALLNASNPDVESDFTAAEVIALVQDAIAPGGITIEQAHQLLAAANEQGCPLN